MKSNFVLDSMSRVVPALLVSFLATTSIQAKPIESPSYFDESDAIHISFETLPGTDMVMPSGTEITTEFESLGVIFSSEGRPGIYQNTDPEDSYGRFDMPFRVVGSLSGGGKPTSGNRYAGGYVYTGWNVSDMRIDFINPVTAVGFNLIDNDFSLVRVSAYDKSGSAIETVIVPTVGEGGNTYMGIEAANISYLIIDAKDGVRLDSTFIDDLSFMPTVAEDAGACNCLISTEALKSARNNVENLIGDASLPKNVTGYLKNAGMKLSKSVRLISVADLPSGLWAIRDVIDQLSKAATKGIDTSEIQNTLASDVECKVRTAFTSVKSAYEENPFDSSLADEQFETAGGYLASGESVQAIYAFIDAYQTLLSLVKHGESAAD